MLLVLSTSFSICSFVLFERVASINSAYQDDEKIVDASAVPVDDEELYGAVGGVPAEFLNDEQVVVNPRRRLVGADDDVHFVDDYYG